MSSGRSPWLLVGCAAIAVIATALAMASSGGIATDLSPMRMTVVGDSDEAFRQVLEREFATTWAPLIILMEADDPPLVPAQLGRLPALESEILALEGVRRVKHVLNIDLPRAEGDAIRFRRLDTSADLLEAAKHPLIERRLLSENAGIAAIIVDLQDLPAEEESAVVDEIIAISERLAPADTTLGFAGFPAVNREYTDLLESSQAWLVPLSAAIMCILLWVLLRRIAPVALTLLAVALAALWSVAALAQMGVVLSILSAALPILLLILGVSMAVHLTAGIDRVRIRGASRAEALAATLRTVGPALGIASLTSAIGFASLVSARIDIVREFGLTMAIGVVALLIASISIVAGGLALLPSTRSAVESDRLTRGLLRLCNSILRRPRAAIALGLGTVIVAGLGGLMVENNEFVRGEVPKGHPLDRAMGSLDEDFAGAHGFVLSVRAPDDSLLSPAVMSDLADLLKWIESTPGVGGTWSYLDWLIETNRLFDESNEVPPSRALAAQYLLLLESIDSDRVLDDLLSFDRSWATIHVQTRDLGNQAQIEIQNALQREIEERSFPPDLELRVAGRGRVYPKAVVQTVEDLVRSYGVAFLCISLVMLVWLRSPRLAIIAMIANLAPSLVAFGIMGYMDILLRLGTSICFAFALGIGVDDTVHFLRDYEARRRMNLDPREAVRTVMVEVGRPIVHSSIVLVIGFLVFTASPFKTWNDMGIITASALFAALVADLIVLPALLICFDDRGVLRSEKSA